MSNISKNFYFGEIYFSPDDYVATVSIGLNEKDQLMRCLDTALQLPDYFSANWDSLEECLSDLQWINCSVVWIKHGDIPLINDETKARTYLDILNVACERFSDINHKQLRVVFPMNFRATVGNLM
jgi:RNAse (barnase) inhibitor barstar